VAGALQGELAQLNGIDVELAPQAFGESDPIATNGSEAGRKQNRRVTIVLPFRTQSSPTPSP
jgi:outer membrane protein OmpA-like peptidoglycan-associated protein